MDIGNETLSAYLDGEVTAEDREAVELALARSPELAERLQRLDAANAHASAVFREIDARPLPEAVTDMLAAPAMEKAAEPRDGLGARLRRLMAPAARPWAMPAAAALALVIGYIGGQMSGGPGTDPARTALLEHAAGVVAESHPLYSVLQSSGSGESRALAEGDALQATPMLSFRTDEGRYCRELAVTGASRASRGVFCRSQEGAWHVETMVAAAPAGDGYRPASLEAPPAVEQTVDRLIAGAPLDSEAEADAITRGWESVD